ncbi:uncharacterized protein LOC143018292 [Oratosquilla oratoria]|uniref:uncharacterized protein LOC143018292 n=1 Tax=Oratosquilla oratoria TaxID=337810 RepID=UPI003F76FE90
MSYTYCRFQNVLNTIYYRTYHSLSHFLFGHCPHPNDCLMVLTKADMDNDPEMVSTKRDMENDSEMLSTKADMKNDSESSQDNSEQELEVNSESTLDPNREDHSSEIDIDGILPIVQREITQDDSHQESEINSENSLASDLIRENIANIRWAIMMLENVEEVPYGSYEPVSHDISDGEDELYGFDDDGNRALPDDCYGRRGTNN